jgi:succinyl-diaminopimelate desuccinylase
LTVKGIQGHVAYPEKARNPIHQAMPALAELAARRWDEGYENFPATSLQISNIHAGTGANNVIPGELQAMFNLRFNPNWRAEQLEAECMAIFDRHGLEYDIRWHRGGEPFYTPEGPLRAAAREVLTAFAGALPEENTAGGTSDARFIAPLGAQCIEIGPVNASIHKVDEHVSVADLERLPDLYRTLIERLLVGASPCGRAMSPDADCPEGT